MKTIFRHTIFFPFLIFGLLSGCSKKPAQHYNAQDSTLLAIANNKLYRLSEMTDSELVMIARNSDPPVHNFTKREQFLEFQRHIFDSLKEHLGYHDNLQEK